jgi:hypothetical protein
LRTSATFCISSARRWLRFTVASLAAGLLPVAGSAASASSVAASVLASARSFVSNSASAATMRAFRVVASAP